MAAPRTFDMFQNEKIIIREITGKYPTSIIATYSDELFLFNRSNICVSKKPESKIKLKYILSLLNSKLLSYYFVKNTAKANREMFPKLILEDLRKFPVKKISVSSQQPFITLVDQILAAKKANAQADTNALEMQIDLMVYKLYDLTYEEVKLIDESVREEEYGQLK